MSVEGCLGVGGGFEGVLVLLGSLGEWLFEYKFVVLFFCVSILGYRFRRFGGKGFVDFGF